MIGPLDGRAEKTHHLIAHQLVQSAVVKKDRSGSDFIEAIEFDGDRRRFKPLRERREAAHIDEQDRYDPSLPARRSQLVSKRAEIGIFSRWPNLHQAKRQ